VLASPRSGGSQRMRRPARNSSAGEHVAASARASERAWPASEGGGQHASQHGGQHTSAGERARRRAHMEELAQAGTISACSYVARPAATDPTADGIHCATAALAFACWP
jgi:hypothetical protein